MSSAAPVQTTTWVLARFDHEPEFVKAAEKMRTLGFDRLDGFIPYPSHGALDAVKPKESIIPRLVFLGGLTGFCFGFALQYFCNVVDYPIQIGGRDLFSAPTYIPICFECVILFSVLTAFGSTIALSGLPRPHHPFFVSAGFNRATTDGFVLGVYAADAEKSAAIQTELKSLGGADVEQVQE